MKIVLTVVLVAIFLAAVWGGYRRGLILSAAQLAAIVVALYGAALLAGLFSARLLPVAEPFAGGYFEGQLDVVATELPDNDAGLSGEDWVAAHPDTAQEYAEQCFAAAGVTGRPAQRMARAALAMRDEQGITLRAAMTQVYCARLCYVLVTSVGFLLIMLILAAIGNLPNVRADVFDVRLGRVFHAGLIRPLELAVRDRAVRIIRAGIFAARGGIEVKQGAAARQQQRQGQQQSKAALFHASPPSRMRRAMASSSG